MAAFSVELAVPGKGAFKASFDVSSNGKRWSQLALGAEKLAGCHAYVTLFRGGLVRVDLRVSNGSVLPNGSGFNGKVYFDSLTVRAPRGLSAFTIPRLGESVNGGVYEVIKPLAGGQHHVLLPRAAFMRTFVLATSAQASAAMKILNRDPIRILNPIKNWGPLKSDFPTIDRAANDARFKVMVDGLRGSLASGAKFWAQDFCDLQPPIGYARLDGESSAGAPGGYGIELSQADCQSRWAFVLREHMAALVMDGRNYACYHANTGEPIKCGEFATPAHERNMAGSGRLEMPFFMNEANGEFRHRVYNAQYEGACPYEQALAAIEAHDVAHSIRGFRHLVCVADTTNEQWAKDELSMYYEFLRTGEWSGREDEQVEPEYPGAWVFPSLSKKVRDAHAQPGTGSWLERSFGWFMFLSAGMLKWFPKRQDIKDDALKLMDVAVTAADPFGITANAWLNASPEFFPEGVSGTQAFHSQYVIHGLFALATQRHGGQIPQPVRDVLTKGCKTLGGTFPGLPKWIGLSFNGTHVTSLSQAYVSQEQDPAPWAALHSGALCYRMTGDKAWLEMVKRHWLSATSLAELRAKLAAQQYHGLAGDVLGVLEGVA